MKNKILELIDSHIYGMSVCNAYGEPQEEYDSEGQIALKKLKKEIKKIEEWIPVTERLPADNKSVLFTDGRITGEGYMEKWNFYWTEDENIGRTVTHWQPLPLPPNPSSHD